MQVSAVNPATVAQPDGHFSQVMVVPAGTRLGKPTQGAHASVRFRCARVLGATPNSSPRSTPAARARVNPWAVRPMVEGAAQAVPARRRAQGGPEAREI
mgnify:CR=1 FL=1